MEPSVTVNNLANLEALLNIIANGVEILGIASGGPNLMLCWIPKACGTPGYTLKLLIAGMVCLIGGLASPGAINWAVATGGPGLGIAVGAVCALLIIPTAIALHFAPSIIAYRENRPSKQWILAFNFCFLIPCNYLIALIWASRGTPVKYEEGIDVNQYR